MSLINYNYKSPYLFRKGSYWQEQAQYSYLVVQIIQECNLNTFLFPHLEMNRIDMETVIQQYTVDLGLDVEHLFFKNRLALHI